MQSSGSARSQGHRPCRSWAAGCVLDGLESCVLGCLSCCSVLLVGLVLCPVPLGRGGVVCDRVLGSAWVAVSRVVLLLVVVDHLVGSAVP